jgi:hypothetical protein
MADREREGESESESETDEGSYNTYIHNHTGSTSTGQIRQIPYHTIPHHTLPYVVLLRGPPGTHITPQEFPPSAIIQPLLPLPLPLPRPRPRPRPPTTSPPQRVRSARFSHPPARLSDPTAEAERQCTLRPYRRP